MRLGPISQMVAYEYNWFLIDSGVKPNLRSLAQCFLDTYLP
jgi:hypothetical protein